MYLIFGIYFLKEDTANKVENITKFNYVVYERVLMNIKEYNNLKTILKKK